ncbi:outer membrane protein assembly factor BamE [Halomonas elongata]|nr:outer membrane protein assembly factor BamE [Halomonas elongata]MDL4861747.1 outer membrane protein assembly factor BamE [Halomonas elongata]WBF17799.1 outer membrane protein assembly factor BamE [Halomonas elongata]WPU46644.1 outer membrane protein assembly factor BamE [Halomonas elongata DSM 2581]WVI71408.1 outer membrane protein assembly factor BamE [Halomonas elongata]CBV44047.2 outer membrane protein assembly factor BamE [Halomonas elongata DSM 2581]
MQKLTRTVTLTVALTLVSGCSYFGVYKRDLAQGNLVTSAMAEQLQPGMTRQQVVNLMGSPMLEAPFDAQQWDYVYRLDKAYGGVEQRRLTLTFQGNRLADIDRHGDFSRPPSVADERGIGPTDSTNARGNLLNARPDDE